MLDFKHFTTIFNKSFRVILLYWKFILLSDTQGSINFITQTLALVQSIHIYVCVYVHMYVYVFKIPLILWEHNVGKSF